MDDEEKETCWICLEGFEAQETRPANQPAPLNANRLIQPCKCPRVVHSVCLAKWQLSQSGKSEEKFCRFCGGPWPDWKSNLALPGMSAVEPVMSVHFNGQTHMVKVRPGEDGRLAFISDVRRLLRLRDNQEFSITFECKVPGHGMFLDLKGLSSYDAAVFCAAMTAVERQRLAAQRAQKAAASAGGAADAVLPAVLPAAAATRPTLTPGPSVWADPMPVPTPALAPIRAHPPTAAANSTAAAAAGGDIGTHQHLPAVRPPAGAAAGDVAHRRGGGGTSSSGSDLMSDNLMSDADIEHLPSLEHSRSSLASSSGAENHGRARPHEAGHDNRHHDVHLLQHDGRHIGAYGAALMVPTHGPVVTHGSDAASRRPVSGEVATAAAPPPPRHGAAAGAPPHLPFDSACEVQSEYPLGTGEHSGGGGGGGGNAGVDSSMTSEVAGRAGFERRKPHRYGRHRLARRTGTSDRRDPGTIIPHAVSDPGVRRVAQRDPRVIPAGMVHGPVAGGAGWLSRFLHCVGFTVGHDAVDGEETVEAY